MNMKTKFKIALSASTLITLALDVIYIVNGGLLLKTLTSFGFVIIGLISTLHAIKSKAESLESSFLVLTALTVCMVGDVTLNLNFVVGALIFALGHVCYFVAYSSIQRLEKRDFIPIGIVLAVSLFIVLFVPVFDFGNVGMRLLCVAYAAVISFMVGKAISNLIKVKSLANVMIAVGAILFYFSDLMLLIELFATKSALADTLCLATYYPAQCLLALHGARGGKIRD